MKYLYKLQYKTTYYEEYIPKNLYNRIYRGNLNTTYYFLEESDMLLFKLKYENDILEEISKYDKLSNTIGKQLSQSIDNQIIQTIMNTIKQ